MYCDVYVVNIFIVGWYGLVVGSIEYFSLYDIVKLYVFYKRDYSIYVL